MSLKRFFCLTFGLVLFLHYSPLVTASPALLPRQPVLEAVFHDVQGVLTTGDRITVAVRGMRRGSAVFHIFGVAEDVPMREVRLDPSQAPMSLYAGTYVVRPGDTAQNAAVFATLAVQGIVRVGSSSRLISIDTRAPVITSRHPQPAARISNLRPSLAIGLVDLETGIDPATVRLIVGGRNVTGKASISENSIVYNPEAPLRAGHVRVELTVSDRAGNTLKNEWAYQIVHARDSIKSVTINPASPLKQDDLLTVVMTGESGGKATFAVHGIRGFVPMKESSTPGIYVGTMPVRKDYSVMNGRLLVTLKKNGRTSRAPSSAFVTILGTLPQAPRVTNEALASASPLVGPISIGGTSGPGFRVVGRITYETSVTGTEGALGEFVALADILGSWQVSFGPVVPLDRARVMLTVIAIDPAGQKSPPTTIELTS